MILISLYTSFSLQPRIFQYLFKLLSKSVKASEVSADVWEEMMVAKAASIYEICKLRQVDAVEDSISPIVLELSETRILVGAS